MIKQKKKISMRPDERAFLLNKALHDDVQSLENSKQQQISDFRIKQAELDKARAEIQGIEASIYAIFRADALTNNRIKKGQQLQFLGDFKYKVVDIPSDQPDNAESVPATDESANEGQG